MDDNFFNQTFYKQNYFNCTRHSKRISMIFLLRPQMYSKTTHNAAEFLFSPATKLENIFTSSSANPDLFQIRYRIKSLTRVPTYLRTKNATCKRFYKLNKFVRLVVLYRLVTFDVDRIHRIPHDRHHEISVVPDISNACI